MNNAIAARRCPDYNNISLITNLISGIYHATSGPEVAGKRVLLKPNILSDSDPSRCITTHPAVIEAMVCFLQGQGAKVLIGDSPAIHTGRFRPHSSGIMEICEVTGAEWVDFRRNPVTRKLRNGTIRVASVAENVDLIISMPKFKNHELVYFSGAIKNTLGLVPGFNKTKQHALHSDRDDFSEFLVQLNEAVMPDYFLMDAVTGMEGPGPARGVPVNIGLLVGSVNPLAVDIVSSMVAGYNPSDIPTNRIALDRGWLGSENDLDYDGPELQSLIKEDFKRIPLSRISNISLKFLVNRIGFLRKLERRPVFLPDECTGCHQCIKICPAGALDHHPSAKNHIKLTDSKCIRCYCCSEVCQDNAIEVRRKLIGV